MTGESGSSALAASAVRPGSSVPDTAPDNASVATDIRHRAWSDATAVLRPYPGLSWLAVHCRPRSEKVVARRCEQLSIPHYLPVQASVRKYRRKAVTFEIPLFSGYLFCAVDAASRLALLRSSKIVSFLSVGDEQQFLAELRQIYVAYRVSSETLERGDFDPTGRRVRILSGPLAGLVGTVLERRGRSVLVLNLGLLQQAAHVQIDMKKTEFALLEPSP